MSDRAEILHGFYADDYARLAVSARDSAAGRYMHGAMEKRFGPDATFARVLELGGNRGEHVPFVRHAFEEYHLTDLRMPQPLPQIADDPRLHLRAVDAAGTPYDDRAFDRVISTCLLHHVDDPLGVAQEMRRVTRPGGVVSILLPTDPGMAYRTTALGDLRTPRHAAPAPRRGRGCCTPSTTATTTARSPPSSGRSSPTTTCASPGCPRGSARWSSTCSPSGRSPSGEGVMTATPVSRTTVETSAGPRTSGWVATPGARRFAFLVFLGALLMQAAWIVAVPPFRGSDEFDHAYRAASVADGDWMPTTPAPDGRGDLVAVSPALVAAAQPVCLTYEYVGPDNCYPVSEQSDGKVLIATAAPATVPSSTPPSAYRPSRSTVPPRCT